MKHLVLSLFLLVSTFSFGQCPEGNITLTSQAEIDQYSADFKDCTTLNGNLIISGTDIIDIGPLGFLEAINGNFTITENPLLQDTQGFLEGAGSTSLFGSLTITNNQSLRSIIGLSAVNFPRPDSDLGGVFQMTIVNNPLLNNCNISNICQNIGIDNLTISDNGLNCVSEEQVKANCGVICPAGNYVFESQERLEKFRDNFPDCQTIGNSIIRGDAITDLSPLNNINTFVGGVLITDTRLSTLEGLESLTQVLNESSFGASLIINNNNNLSSFKGLENLEIAEDLQIIGNDLIQDFSNLGASTLTITNEFLVEGNSSLQRFTGFNNLDVKNLSVVSNNTLFNFLGTNIQNITSNLKIEGNTQLLSLDGLEILQGSFRIDILSNPRLFSIDGLSGLDFSSGFSNFLVIQNNARLSNCAIDNLCEDFSRIENKLTVAGNAIGCSSKVEVKDSCLGCPDGDIILTTQAEVNQFALDFQNCIEPFETLGIMGDDIVDISALNFITELNLLGIEAPNLTSLAGLENISQLDQLSILNTGIINLEGLSSVAELQEFVVIGNQNLENLNGLNEAIVIEDLQIESNQKLLNISDVPIAVTSQITLGDNSSLRTLSGLERTIDLGSIIIVNNPSLQSLIGLDNLEIIGRINLQGNDSLINLEGLGKLARVVSSFTIGGNASLLNLEGLPSNFEVFKIIINENDSLETLASNSVISVTTDFSVTNNSMLLNIDGLSIEDNLADLLIGGNPLLNDISALNLQSQIASTLTVVNNQSLSQCSVNLVCNSLLQGNPNNRIENNAPDCNSIEEVQERCEGCPIGDVTLTSQAEVNQFAIDFPECTVIERNFTISGDDITDLTPLSNITKVGRGISISNNPQLVSINGLQNLSTVSSQGFTFLTVNNNSLLESIDELSNLNANTSGTNGFDSVIIRDNPNLESLDGLISVGGAFLLEILNNDSITNIDGLRNCVMRDDIFITGNLNLSTCAIDEICRRIETFEEGELFSIENNAPGCNSLEEVQEECTGCPAGNITLTSQAQVDQFAIDFPECTQLTGVLSIEGNDITDLTPLSNLSSIGFGLLIENNTSLSSLEGLHNINLPSNENIRVSLVNNQELTNIQGLRGIQTTPDNNGVVPIDLTVINNPKLENLLGLEGIRGITFSFTFKNNPLIQNFQGLNNLVLPDDLFLEDMSSLTSFEGLNSLRGIGGLDIINCDALLSLTGLPENLGFSGIRIRDNENLVSIDALATAYGGFFGSEERNPIDFSFTGNPNLSNCAITSVCSTIAEGGNIFIENNAPNCNSIQEVAEACGITCPSGDLTLLSQEDINQFAIDFPECTELNGSLFIDGADSNITNLSPLGNITLVSSRLDITNTTSLASLQGLHNITTLAIETQERPRIIIKNNAALENVDELSSLTVNLTLEDNIAFEIWLVENQMLNSVEGFSSISGLLHTIEVKDNPNLASLSGFNNVGTINGLFVERNNLSDFSGLENVTNMNILLLDESNVTSLNGLQNIIELNAALLIENNPNLNNISALSNTILDLDTLGIRGNPQLSQCAIDSLCDALEAFRFGIDNNAPGCNSNQEVEVACSTGCPPIDITLATQAEVNQFAIDFPDCANLQGTLIIDGEDITDLTPLSNIIKVIDRISIENTALVTLQGLDNLQGIEKEGQFTVSSLEIQNNTSLESIGSLSNLNFLPFEGVEASPDAVIRITDNPSLRSLNGLQGVTNEVFSLRIINNALINDLVGLENIKVQDFFLIKDNIAFNSFNGLGLTQVFQIAIANNDALQDFSTFPNNMSVGHFVIFDNDSLTNITGIGSLQQLDEASPISADIINNDMLTGCEARFLCDILSRGNPELRIENNAPGCNSVEEVEQECNETFNDLFGNVMYDFNDNNCDSGDYNVEGILIKIENAENSMMTSTDALGNYRFFLEEGKYTVSVVQESLPDGFTASPSSATITFTGTGMEDMADFCLNANEANNDLRVTIFPIEEARPGFETDYQIVYENVGTTLLSGFVGLNFEADKMTFTRSNPDALESSEGYRNFRFENLQPFETRSVFFTTEIFRPGTVDGGDVLEYIVEIDPRNDDATPSDNRQVFEQEVVNSFDPNDKAVIQGEQLFEEEIPTTFDYLIRFQNTGTASAVNITVTDTLQNNLQWNTLKTVSTSHPYRLEVEDGNIAKFIFEDIFLPAEQDDAEGSNGYIAFKIKPTALEIGDIVQNTANIFFDFNEPIITNTVSTEIVAPLTVADVDTSTNVRLYPNPTTGMLNISLSENSTLKAIDAYSILGSKVISSATNQIDLSTLEAGVYFVDIATTNGHVVKRVIKK